jgi:hypothetical protein
MKEVSKEEFYKHVGPLDACLRIENPYKWPYTVLFEIRHNRALIGKSVESFTDGIENNYPTVKKYFINQ